MISRNSAADPSAKPPATVWGWLRLYGELGKVRLGSLVVLTAIAGYALGSRGSFRLLDALSLAVGTLLSAAGANGLNQLIEVERDRKMRRTEGRPLPSGRVGRRHVLVLCLIEIVTGLSLLLVGNNTLTATLSAFVVVTYVAVYTPLKPVSSINTLIGAVCGAIPPMMGWAAATGGLETGAWILGATLFVWQVPHFLALSWLYREDYRRGGYKMLPVSDPSGTITCRMALLYSMALIPIGLTAAAAGMAGWIYAMGAVLLGGWMIERSARLLQRRSDRAARQVFFVSLAYLPLLLGLMVADERPIRPVTSGAAMARGPTAAAAGLVLPTPEELAEPGN